MHLNCFYNIKPLVRYLPVQPEVQVHLKALTKSMQVAPFWHGLYRHSLILALQFLPEKIHNKYISMYIHFKVFMFQVYFILASHINMHSFISATWQQCIRKDFTSNIIKSVAIEKKKNSTNRKIHILFSHIFLRKKFILAHYVYSIHK